MLSNEVEGCLRVTIQTEQHYQKEKLTFEKVMRLFRTRNVCKSYYFVLADGPHETCSLFHSNISFLL